MAQGAAAVLLGLDPFGREVLERFQQGAARGVSELAVLSPQSCLLYTSPSPRD